jgi:hypothetical protein
MAKINDKYEVGNYYWVSNSKTRHAKCYHIETYQAHKPYFRIYMVIVDNRYDSEDYSVGVIVDFDINSNYCSHFKQMTNTETVLFADKRLSEVTHGTVIADIKGNKGEQNVRKFTYG